MIKEDEKKFDEPKAYSISKYRLGYSSLVIIIIIGMMIFDNEPTPPICFGAIGIFAIYLFFPFTYKLIVSNESISSISIFGERTLEWNEIFEIKASKKGLFLFNADSTVKVFINQQIDDYPLVIKFVQQQCPNLWKSEDSQAFHQNIIEATLFGVLGFPAIYLTIVISLENGISFSQDILTLMIGLVIGGVLLWQGIKIREITFDMDILVVKYIAWEYRIHVNDINSVELEQQMGKNEISYPVHIKLKNGRQLVIEKIKEGNPVLLNAIEKWMETYKGK